MQADLVDLCIWCDSQERASTDTCDFPFEGTVYALFSVTLQSSSVAVNIYIYMLHEYAEDPDDRPEQLFCVEEKLRSLVSLQSVFFNFLLVLSHLYLNGYIF